MKRWIRDVIYSVVLLAFSILLWLEANNFIQNVIKIPLAMPSTYAHLWAGLLGALALIQLIRALVTRPDEKLPKIFTPLAVITLVSLVVYVATLRFMGFLLNTFLLMAILILSYSFAMGKIDRENKKKMVLQILCYLAASLVISFLIRYIFVNLLGAKLPKGKLPKLF